MCPERFAMVIVAEALHPIICAKIAKGDSTGDSFTAHSQNY